MKIENIHNDIRYTLSNDNLKNGDKVFGIGSGRCLGDDDWILHKISFNHFTSGFPDDPATIEDTKYDTYKPFKVKTNYGYQARECYYKIVKMETHVKIPSKLSNDVINLDTWKWMEMEIPKEYHNNN